MKGKLTSAWEQIKTFFGKMSKKTRTMLTVVLLLILAGSVAVAIVLNNRPYTALFTGLSSDEARSIMSYLDTNGAGDYRLENGSTIMVPRGQEDILKARLMMEGYPKSGFAYEPYFNNVSAMSTESERNTAFLIALQDRLAAVIRNLDGVRDANVNINQGEDRTFVLSSDAVVEASASVQVTMQDGQKMPGQYAVAIRNLVSKAVKGLSIEQISISDSQGNVYSGEDGAASIGEASQLKLNLEEQVNNMVRSEIMQVLAPLFGTENVRVSVNSTVDVSRSVGTSTTYQSPEGAPEGEGIIGTKVFDQEVIRGTPEGGAGGTVGAGVNSDLPTYVQNEIDNAAGDSTYLHNSGSEEHNVNQQQEQVERPAGTVTDVMVAVSINSTVGNSVNQNALLNHVARAAGITTEVQADKISILTADFYTPEETPIIVPPSGINLPTWAIYAAIGGGALLLFLLILIAVLRGKSRKRKARELEAMLNQIPAEGEEAVVQKGADIMNIRTEKSMELRKDIREFAETSPEIAAQMLKGWLKGGEEGHG